MNLDYIRKLAGITETDPYHDEAIFEEGLNDWCTDEELFEELSEFLANPAAVQLAEKSKPGFMQRAKNAVMSLFKKKSAAKSGTKKAFTKAAGPKRKLAPDEKMVFGVIRKIGGSAKKPAAAIGTKKAVANRGTAKSSTAKSSTAKSSTAKSSTATVTKADVRDYSADERKDVENFTNAEGKPGVKSKVGKFTVSTVQNGKNSYQTIVFGGENDKELSDAEVDANSPEEAQQKSMKFVKDAANRAVNNVDAYGYDDKARKYNPAFTNFKL